MTLLVGIVLAYLLWGVAASMYDVSLGNQWVLAPVDSSVSIRRARPNPIVIFVGGLWAFFSTSIRYIPSCPWVLSYVITQRTWFAVVAVLVECGVVAFGLLMKTLEKSLEKTGGHGIKKGKRPAAIRTPKPLD
ncbi:hypothetical protein GC163_09300 [bacterium]|nr:hypothetical protein [bacterium]